MISTDTTLTVTLTSIEADALAQLLKRIGFTECRALAASDAEAYLMRDACDVIAKTLASLNHAPR